MLHLQKDLFSPSLYMMRVSGKCNADGSLVIIELPGIPSRVSDTGHAFIISSGIPERREKSESGRKWDRLLPS
jgi:hypothetical protein